ncbi:MAG: hypothetical protein ACK53K_01090 [Burkholderiales bacterium]|jgi:hypothetical protein
MMERIRCWLAGHAEGLDIASLWLWSRQIDARLRYSKEVAGFAIEGVSEGRPWRLDWGPAQRAYISGHELLIRTELGLPANLQMLLMNCALASSLEALAFAQCVQTLQTVVDFSAPEEIRWLSMFPKAQLATALAAHYESWSSSPSLAPWWLEGPLSTALQDLAESHLPQNTPFLLMTLRGRLYLRCQISTPVPDVLEPIRSVFTLAARQALQIASMSLNESKTCQRSGGIFSGLWAHLSKDDDAEYQRRHPPA